MTDLTDEQLDWLEHELHGLAASSMPFLSSTADAITQLRSERNEAKRLAEYLRAERDALRIEAKIAHEAVAALLATDPIRERDAALARAEAAERNAKLAHERYENTRQRLWDTADRRKAIEAQRDAAVKALRPIYEKAVEVEKDHQEYVHNMGCLSRGRDDQLRKLCFDAGRALSEATK